MLRRTTRRCTVVRRPRSILGASRGQDDTGSMATALLVMLIGLTLGPLLLNIVLREVSSTKHTGDRVRAMNAAQAGLNVALAHIRAASNASGGHRPKLPCVVLHGPVDPAAEGDPARYEVTIDYFLSDPSGHQDDLTAIAGSRVPCTAAGPASVPGFALLRSRGTGAGDLDQDGVVDPNVRSWRTIYATYTFSTTGEDIPGGTVRIHNTPGRLCLGATSTTSTANNYLIARRCSDPVAFTTWVYPKNLTLVLAAARTSALPRGLCAHADNQADGEPVVLVPCAAPTDFHQQWRFGADAFTYDGTADGVSDSGFCFNMEVPDAVNSRIVLRSGSHCRGFDSSRTFFPDPDVGWGASGPDTGQLVNRGEVGRCLDLPLDDVTGKVYTEDGRERALITYPCKQAFDGNVHWNHRWTIPAMPADAYQVTGPVTVTPDEADDPGYGNTFCLASPGAAPGRVWVKSCVAGDETLQWTRTERAPLLENSYRLHDAFGNCLQAVGRSANWAYKLDAWSQVVTRPCDGDPLQQWNVPATVSAAPLKDLGEQ